MTPSLCRSPCKKLALRRVERTLIAPSIMESVKAITALYTAEQLITRETRPREDSEQTQSSNETLMEKDLAGLLTIANVAITDFTFCRI